MSTKFKIGDRRNNYADTPINEWGRVKECVVCGSKRCRESPDGKAVWCYRDNSLHQLSQHQATVVHARPPAKPQPAAKPTISDADADRGYRAFLDKLTLSVDHRADLEQRQLSGNLWTSGYRSFDPRSGVTRVAVEAAWAVLGGQLKDLPLVNKPRASVAGLVVPVKDVLGRIVGLRVRADNPGEGGKYRWGRGAVARCHVALPTWAKPEDATGPVVWITEGEIKAEIAAQHLGTRVVSLPGVSTGREEVAGILRQLGATEAVIAFDADDPTKTRTIEAVNKARAVLTTRLQADGLRVSYASWPTTHGKGLDDMLVAGHKPTVAPAPVLEQTETGEAAKPAHSRRPKRRSRAEEKAFLRRVRDAADWEVAKAADRALLCGETRNIKKCSGCGSKFGPRKIAAENPLCPHCSAAYLQSLEKTLASSPKFLPEWSAVGSIKFPETGIKEVSKHRDEIKKWLDKAEKGFAARVRFVPSPSEVLFYASLEDAWLIEKAVGRVRVLDREDAARAIRLVVQKRRDRILDYFDRDDPAGLAKDEWARRFVGTSAGKIAKKTLRWPSAKEIRDTCADLRRLERGETAGDEDHNKLSPCCSLPAIHVLERNGKQVAERRDKPWGIADVQKKFGGEADT